MYLSNTLPYIILFVLFSISAIGENGLPSRKSSNELLKYFIFISYTYFFCCRAFIASDWLYYYPYFEKAPTLFDGSGNIKIFLQNSLFEKGYAFYNILLKTIYPNYLFLQFVSAFIDFLILHYFFKQYIPRYYILGWALYLIFQGYVFEIIILRNAKSIMLFLISIKYINQKKPLKYFILNLLGLCFHTSAIFYLPIYFLGSIKRRPKIEIIVFFIGNIVYLLNIQWIKEILFNLPILPGRAQSMLNIYLSSETFSSAYGLTIGYLERTFSFVLLYKYSFKLIDKDPKYRLFWYLFFLYICIYLFCSEMSILLERIPNLFVCSYWILYPCFYGSLKKDNKILFILIFLFYGVLKTMSLMNAKWAFYENFLSSYSSPQYRKQYLTY